MFPPLRRDPRYRALDAWRAVACLLVVYHHAGMKIPRPPAGSGPVEALARGLDRLYVGGNVGVPMFFVISGYCITASADARRRAGSPLAPLAFLGRRFWRIFPPYWASLAWIVGLCAALDAAGLSRLYLGGPESLGLVPYTWPTRDQWLGNLTLTETWRTHVWGHDFLSYTIVNWTLCFEEQFYFVAFVVLLAFPRRLFAGLAAATGAATTLRILAYDSGGLHRLLGTFPVLWHEFAVGIAVYWLLNRPGSIRARVVVLGLLAALLVAGVWTEFDSTTQASAFGFLLLGLGALEGRLPRMPGSGVLYACGRRCYSIYLTHIVLCPIVITLLGDRGVRSFWARTLITTPAILAASLAVGWTFFALVERHFLGRPVVRRRADEPLSDGLPGVGEAPHGGRGAVGAGAVVSSSESAHITRGSGFSTGQP